MSPLDFSVPLEAGPPALPRLSGSHSMILWTAGLEHSLQVSMQEIRSPHQLSELKTECCQSSCRARDLGEVGPTRNGEGKPFASQEIPPVEDSQ